MPFYGKIEKYTDNQQTLVLQGKPAVLRRLK